VTKDWLLLLQLLQPFYIKQDLCTCKVKQSMCLTNMLAPISEYSHFTVLRPNYHILQCSDSNTTRDENSASFRMYFAHVVLELHQTWPNKRFTIAHNLSSYVLCAPPKPKFLLCQFK
jgi:hypothetical protein